MERTVLHVDCNKFYASVECLHRPELRDKPVAVGGSTESRHGIILTKNEIASRYGLVAGEPLWQARQKCPQLVVVPPNFPLYMRFSKMARRIYEDYSDYIEPFGLDENWLDVTGDDRTGEQIAQEIQRDMAAKERTAMQPILQDIRKAIQQVRQEKGLDVILEAGAVIDGGTDVTSEVGAKLTK